MADFREGVRVAMAKAVVANGHTQAEADVLVEPHLDTCQGMAQTAWDTAITDLKSSGMPDANARIITIPAAIGAAWQWAKANIP